MILLTRIIHAQGDDIDPNLPIISHFNQKIAKGSTVRHWDSIIVISHSEREFLPVSMRDCKAHQTHPSAQQIKNTKKVDTAG